MKIALWSLLILLLGCSEDKQSEIKEACGNESLVEIRKVDNISSACRAALSSILPGPEDNLKSRLFSFAQDSSSLYLAAVDGSGNALSKEILATVKVKGLIDGTVQDLPAGAFTVESVSTLDADVLSISLLSDYSGSMPADDIADVSALYSDFSAFLMPIAEMEHILFSSTVLQKADFTRSQAEIDASLAFDSSIERASTALFDGMGLALEHLSASSSPGKIIVIGTDGMENASINKTKEAILSAIAAEPHLLVVFMASNFADLNLIKELTGGKGFYAFMRSIREAKTKMLEFSKALREGIKITLITPYDTLESLTVEVPDQELSGTFER